MSTPTSFMASTALGLTPCVSMPPEYTFHSSPKIAFPKPQPFGYDKNSSTNKINGL